jgi:hypothetical protein
MEKIAEHEAASSPPRERLKAYAWASRSGRLRLRLRTGFTAGVKYTCGASATMETLRVGERFPVLEARAVEDSTLRIPDDLHDLTAVLLFYRGHW